MNGRGKREKKERKKKLTVKGPGGHDVDVEPEENRADQP